MWALETKGLLKQQQVLLAAELSLQDRYSNFKEYSL